jgi:hypothetical protein
VVGHLDRIFSPIFILRIDERNKEIVNEHAGTEGRIKWKKVENRRDLS